MTTPLRFVIVRIAATTVRYAGLHHYRATAIKPDGKAVDMWFWTGDIVQAKARVRCKYPDCTFSDETVS